MTRFEIQSFEKDVTPLTQQPMVTLQKTGSLSLNRAAWKALGNPDAVETFYDSDARAIGLRATRPDAPSAHRIYSHPNRYGYRMSLQRFCRFYGIETTKNLRYELTVDEDILVIELDKPLYETTNSKRKPTKE